ncbi:MAG: IS200/IS605 family transposase [Melioribacteraceae bacterium]|nr:IS200/IS605 family transposase [Melioribacteraceae bacterium]
MSWVRVWIHLVFSTKNREPVLHTKELREKVFNHIKENAKEKGIWLDSINGYKEHIHCLISLSKEQSISKVAQLIKGESSFWINKNKLTKTKFIWQDDYWAVSVSESHIESVRKYIEEQEEHHRLKTFTEEVDEFMKKYGWSFVKNDSG